VSVPDSRHADPSYAVVVPTVGRPSLATLLDSLVAAGDPLPAQVVVVDDRPRPPALPEPPPALAGRLVVRCSGGHGPAAARNVGWRAVEPATEWVVFVDDDVVLGPDWAARLREDLRQPPDVGGVQARIAVPLPADRRPTDWERVTRGLADAAWITADMAYRRAALAAVGGFDERFPRAFREDADLALRVQENGWRLVRGSRGTTHPVRPADRWVSVRTQAGNGDDVLMRRLHGRHWRRAARAPAGRRRRHLAVTTALAVAVAAAAARRPAAARLAAALWAAGTGELAWARIASGPRDRAEVTTMGLTSVAIPPMATWHWLRGCWRHRGARPWPAAARVRAVLFDRDGTLVHDVPYNGDPDAVRPVDGAVEVVRRLRDRGVRTGVVTNQSGVARGLLSGDDVARVNARVDDLFGGFDVWAVCPHGEADRCRCRKPAPGLVLDAAARLGVAVGEVAVVGDIGADVRAAQAAGARAVLVPTAQTRPEEVRRAPLVARDLAEAVRLLLGAPR
jgi:histidinol-phosphate phosphatase family protein